MYTDGNMHVQEWHFKKFLKKYTDFFYFTNIQNKSKRTKNIFELLLSVLIAKHCSYVLALLQVLVFFRQS